MARTPRKPRLSTGKASKPDLKPLDPHLADLLNPALNREREAADGFGERALETYAHGDATGVDPALAEKLGLSSSPRVRERSGRASARVKGPLRRRLFRIRPLTLPSPRVRGEETKTTPRSPPTASPQRSRRSPDCSPKAIHSSRTAKPGRRTARRGPKNPKAASVHASSPTSSPPAISRTAIAELVEGVRRQERDQVLLGVTGSGKTFTMAKIIEETQRPALILAPNKTLAAQLYGEFKSFFPGQRRRVFRLLLRLLPAGGLRSAHRHLHREGIAPSTSRSTACATPRRAPCSSATTSSSSPPSPASTASARSRPTRP